MPTAIRSEPRFSTGALSSSGRCALCACYLRVVLDLGQQPLANGLLAGPNDPAPTLPLRLASCPGCGHVQLADFAAPEALFGEYVYRTGASEPARRHFDALAGELRAALVTSTGYVCEVGSNDGTLLKAVRERGLEAVGVDPCSVARGVEGTVCRYFDPHTAAMLLAERGPARAVVMCNVLAHCPDPCALIRGARDLVAYGGLLVIEAPYLFDMLALGAWDTIYHEHAHTFAASSLHRILTAHGFMVERVDRLPVHGGSLRVWARRYPDVQAAPRNPEWSALLAGERYPDWAGFQARVDRHARALREACAGKRLAAYGAAAKATVLLNYTGLRPAFIVDTTPDKQGRFVPGTATPIVPPSALSSFEPEAVLLTAWNYADHVLAAHPELAGRWVIPFGPHRTVETA